MPILSHLLKPSQRSPEIDAVLRKFIDQFFIIFVITGTLSLAGSLTRVIQFGWLFQQIIHTIVYIAFITGFLIRKKFSVPVISLILFSLAGIDAVANLYTFGLASTGTLMLGYMIIMMATFISFQAGMIAIVVCIALLFGFAFAISSGLIPMNFDETRYVTSITAWLTQISTFIVIVTTAIIATCGIKARLLDSLQEKKKQQNDLVQLNQYLIKSEKKNRAIIETAPEAITTIDLNGIITSCNQASVDLLKYSDAQELIGMNCAELIALEDRDRIITTFKSTLEKNIIKNIEYNVFTKDRSVIPVKTAASVLRDENEEAVGYLTITQDISHSRKMEAQLRHAEKMEAIGQLAGGIAHDFNNQLTGIIGFAQLLRSDMAAHPQYIQDIDSIITTAERGSVLIRQLLAFARKEQNHSKPIDMHQIIADVISILQRTIDKKIVIKQHLNAQNPIVLGDPALLQSALLNLTLNARDAMLDGGTLTISTELATSPKRLTESMPAIQDTNTTTYVSISVTDTGIGMDEEIKKKIFNPFFTTKEPGKGTGMGLASVYGTINSHKGSIAIESKPKQGTTLTIYLPQVEVDENHPENADILFPPQKTSTRILLVDDEEVVIKVTTKLLEKAGYSIFTCKNGKEAVDLYTQQWKDIDLVVLDMLMPVMGGKETFHSLKAINKNVRVLLCSGHDPHQAIQRLIREPGVDFISKPYQVETFLNKITNLLNN